MSTSIFGVLDLITSFPHSFSPACITLLLLILSSTFHRNVSTDEAASFNFSVVEVDKGSAQSLAWSWQGSTDYLSLATPPLKMSLPDPSAVQRTGSSKDISKDMAAEKEQVTIPGSLLLKTFLKDDTKTQELYVPTPINKVYSGLLLGISYLVSMHFLQTLSLYYLKFIVLSTRLSPFF